MLFSWCNYLEGLPDVAACILMLIGPPRLFAQKGLHAASGNPPPVNSGEERQRQDSGFPGLGRPQEGRKEERTGEREAEPSSKGAKRTRLRGLLNWVKSSQDGTRK